MMFNNITQIFSNYKLDYYFNRKNRKLKKQIVAIFNGNFESHFNYSAIILYSIGIYYYYVIKNHEMSKTRFFFAFKI